MLERAGRALNPGDDWQARLANELDVRLRWPRPFEQNFRVVKWIVGRGYAAVRSGNGSK